MEQLDIVATLDLLNFYLKKKNTSRAFTICGGASLILQKISTRATKDIDVIAPEIDKILKEASEEVAHKLDLSPDWLNTDPKGLSKDMSKGWEERVIKLYENSHLIVSSISREDMVFAKFYAYCDRQKDIYDLIDLAPTRDELKRAVNLTKKMDANPEWPNFVERQNEKLKKKLNYE